jgi:hypothetical protein
MIDLMKNEQARYAIGRDLWDLPMASKYGALDRLRSAVGIIYTRKARSRWQFHAMTCPKLCGRGQSGLLIDVSII